MNYKYRDTERPHIPYTENYAETQARKNQLITDPARSDIAYRRRQQHGQQYKPNDSPNSSPLFCNCIISHFSPLDHVVWGKFYKLLEGLINHNAI